MIPTGSFTGELTPKTFKNDPSPNYRIALPGFRSPKMYMRPEEDNSKTTPRLPFTENLDFESKYLSATT